MEKHDGIIIKQKAIYEQVADYYIEQILLGEFSAGDSFPSVSKICACFGISSNTAWRVLDFLSEKGFISSKRGVGYFCTNQAFDNAYSALKEKFVRYELPTILRKMEILNVDISTLTKQKPDFEEGK